MAKAELDKVIAKAKDVTIVTRKLTQEELDAFVVHVSSLPKPRNQEVSLTSYVKDKFYADRDRDDVIIPDITGLKLESPQTGLKFNGIDTGAIDLQGVDFTGSIINGVKFINCNLTDAVFRECDMNDVYFDKSILVNADFRGAILIGATLGPSYDFIGQRAAELEVRGLEFIPEEEMSFGRDRERSSGFSLDYEEQQDKRQEAREAQVRNYQREQEAASAREKEVQKREKALIKGAKFDTTLSLAYAYKREHSDERSTQKAQAQKELEKAIAKKEKELADKRQSIEDRISERQQDVGVVTSWFWGDEEISRLHTELEKHDREAPKELAALEKSERSKLAEKFLAFREDSFVRVFHSSSEFDPCYKRGSSAAERNAKHMYIETSRTDVEAYLAAIKMPGQEKLTLNEFVRDKYNKEQLAKEQSARERRLVGVNYTTIPDDVIVHADCSSGSYSTPKDFSGLVFEGAHLQDVNFAGSNLERATFTNTDISNSSFESCEMSRTTFTQVIARGARFFRANLQGTTISANSDFTNTILTKANATGATISQTNLSRSQGQYVILDRTGISDSILDGSDFTGASLISATIERTSMIGIRLDHAVLEHCKMVECDLRAASLENVKAQYAEFHKVQLQNIKAQNANFVDAYFDELCNLDEADLQKAVMERVKLNGVSLVGAQMQFADLRNAELEKAIVEGAQMQFADLTDAIAHGLKASGVNMTGATLEKVKARGADFRKAILQDVNAQGADFQKSIMEEANLLGAKFTDAILKEVELRKAKVNLHTDFTDADIEGVIGADELIEQVIQEDGTVVEEQNVKLEEHMRRVELVKDAQSKGFVLKALGNFIQGTGTVIENVGGFVKQPFSDRIGLKGGAIVGLVIALCVVASVAAPLIPGAWLATPFITTAVSIANLIPGVSILTSSIALATIPVQTLAVAIGTAAPTIFAAVGISASAATIPIFATSVAAVVTTVASVAGGALAGRYVVQHTKLSHIAAATAGFATGLAYGVILGPLAPLVGIGGAIAGVVSTIAVNTASEKLTGGRTLDGLLSAGIGWAGSLTKHFGGRVGITPEQAELLKEHAAYKPVNREEYAQQLAAEKAKPGPVEHIQVISVPVQSKPISVQAPVLELQQPRPSVSLSSAPERSVGEPSNPREVRDVPLASSTVVLGDQPERSPSIPVIPSPAPSMSAPAMSERPVEVSRPQPLEGSPAPASPIPKEQPKKEPLVGKKSSEERRAILQAQRGARKAKAPSITSAPVIPQPVAVAVRSDSDQPRQDSVPAPTAPTKKPLTIPQTLAVVALASKYKQWKQKRQEAAALKDAQSVAVEVSSVPNEPQLPASSPPRGKPSDGPSIVLPSPAVPAMSQERSVRVQDVAPSQQPQGKDGQSVQPDGGSSRDSSKPKQKRPDRLGIERQPKVVVPVLPSQSPEPPPSPSSSVGGFVSKVPKKAKLSKKDLTSPDGNPKPFQDRVPKKEKPKHKKKPKKTLEKPAASQVGKVEAQKEEQALKVRGQ